MVTGVYLLQPAAGCYHGNRCVPVAALCRVMLWYPGVDRPLLSFMEESSFRMSRLSFRLLLAVLAALHFVFLLGILVGNFILSFLLFS